MTSFIDTARGPIIAVDLNPYTVHPQAGARLRVTWNEMSLTVKETEKLIDALIDTLPVASRKRLENILYDMNHTSDPTNPMGM